MAIVIVTLKLCVTHMYACEFFLILLSSSFAQEVKKKKTVEQKRKNGDFSISANKMIKEQLHNIVNNKHIQFITSYLPKAKFEYIMLIMPWSLNVKTEEIYRFD